MAMACFGAVAARPLGTNSHCYYSSGAGFSTERVSSWAWTGRHQCCSPATVPSWLGSISSLCSEREGRIQSCANFLMKTPSTIICVAAIDEAPTGAELELEFFSQRRSVHDSALKVEEILSSAGTEEKESILADLEQQAAQSNLWEDPTKAHITLSNLTDLTSDLSMLKSFQSKTILWIRALDENAAGLDSSTCPSPFSRESKNGDIEMYSTVLGGLGLLVCALQFPEASLAAIAVKESSFPTVVTFAGAEPSNALSLPTWVIHVASVVEWVTAMALVWKYGDTEGKSAWKGLTWGMVPLLGGAMCACTWHFFYNAESLEILVVLQAFLTVVGNFTMWAAAYRIWKLSQEKITVD